MESCHIDCLQLTSGQQDILAQFCSIARRVCYELTEGEINSEKDIGEEIIDVVQRAMVYNFTPQSFDRLYDLLHRSGANS